MTDKPKEYRNTLKRALRIMKALKGRTIEGLTLTALSKAIDDSPVNTLRAINALIDEGFMQKLDSGNYALSYHILQIAIEYGREMDKAYSRLDQIKHRVQAGSFA
ncbi:IclR family transcriptional regulator [Pasteurellaceae bacterium USgator11]|nr:IclR family transcriptional regulator [Pasteurellaceae bacterium USgator41]TNG98691.1 IclR family transcriptional regulator [Pasteurellaceae bacterium UScroc31]TNH00058.1 IclR family transcriptional regulator [Pasteurellaceae bacterium USgator11]